MSVLMPKPRLFKSRKSKKGLAPGSLIHVGQQPLSAVKVTIIDFTPERATEKQAENLDECLTHVEDPGSVTWINMDGVHDTEMIRHLGERLDIHALVLEDIMNTDQRAKFEDHDDYLYIVLKMLYLNNGDLMSEQVSVLVGEHYVISCQEQHADTFDTVRERIRQGKTKIRTHGADYTAYALIDSVVDNYFTVLEREGDLLEVLEGELLEDPSDDNLQRIHGMKRELLMLRKFVWPLREMLHALQRSDTDIFKEETRLYIRDVYDHVVQVIDILETCRELASGLMDVYLSSVSNRMNGVMKVLTIISTIFIPLTFIAGIYGMNFDHMPELHWSWAYPAVWGVMLLVTLAMVIFFRRKEWI